MKHLILFAAILATAWAESDYDEEEKKYNINKATTFKNHLIPFNTRLALEANYYTKGHFIISAHSVWYKLASFCEHMDGEHKDLFSLFNLPDDRSVRQNFYNTALFLEGHGDYTRSHALALDETVKLEGQRTIDLLIPFAMPDYLPSVHYDKPFGHVKQYVPTTKSGIPYSSHTVLLDHSIFNALWSAPFSDNPIQRGPFYDKEGKSIATVEYFRMKGKVRTANFPNNVKVVEIPINKASSMILAVGGTAESKIESVFKEDIFAKLTLTEKDIEVIIPKLAFSSGFDMGAVFKDIKSSKEFSDPSAIRKSPDDPALPLGYFQMVSVNILDSEGRETSKHQAMSHSEIDFTSLDKDCFVVNESYLFSLFVPHYLTDIKSPVFTGIYSYPGEIGQKKIFD